MPKPPSFAVDLEVAVGVSDHCRYDSDAWKEDNDQIMRSVKMNLEISLEHLQGTQLVLSRSMFLSAGNLDSYLYPLGEPESLALTDTDKFSEEELLKIDKRINSLLVDPDPNSTEKNQLSSLLKLRFKNLALSDALPNVENRLDIYIRNHSCADHRF